MNKTQRKIIRKVLWNLAVIGGGYIWYILNYGYDLISAMTFINTFGLCVVIDLDELKSEPNKITISHEEIHDDSD